MNPHPSAQSMASIDGNLDAWLAALRAPAPPATAVPGPDWQDPIAFARLVADHQALVLSLGRAVGLTGADLDDAATEAFAAVYQAMPGFEGRSRLSTWIHRIAWRTLLRARGRQRSRAHLPTAAVAQAAAATVAPDAALTGAETQSAVWAAVAALPPAQAAAVELFYRQDWPLETIAEVLDCPLGTVKTHLFRARATLRGRLSGWSP